MFIQGTIRFEGSAFCCLWFPWFTRAKKSGCCKESRRFLRPRFDRNLTAISSRELVAVPRYREPMTANYPCVWQVQNRLLTLPLHEYRYRTAYLPYRYMSTGTEPLIYPTVTWVQVQNCLFTLPLHEYRYRTTYLPYRYMSTGTEPLIYPTVTWVQVQNRLFTLP